jgi:trimeric autotransporter adhesin
MKTTILFGNYMHRSLGRCAFFSLLITCFALPRMAKAVVPPPDGGYPGFNTAEGQNALFSLTTGVANTAVGWFSLFSNTDGSFNTAVGAGALLSNVGNQNTNEGLQNTAIGAAALLSNTTGRQNTATGVTALVNNTTGLSNTAVGTEVLHENTIGFLNTAIGFRAGYNQTTGNGNVYIGAGMFGVPGESDACYIRSIYGKTTVGGAQVFINGDNKLGTITSSKRFKEEIKPMDQTSEALFGLKPVTFHYKKEIDPAGTSQFGLVAEDVEKVNPALIVRDKEGKPCSVRYDQVNAMLLNEFLKEHRTVQELKATAAKQEATIAKQQKQIEALTAGLQKVSAQLELSKAAPQTVLNNQ